MKKKQKLKITVVIDGVPKVVDQKLLANAVRCGETEANRIWEALVKAHERSEVYGLGGSTRKNLEGFFAPQLERFAQLQADSATAASSKTMLFAEAFQISSNQSPILMSALEWVEKKSELQDFKGGNITLDRVLLDSYLNGLLKGPGDPYKLMVADFHAWAGESLSKANLHVGFVRFLKFFYSLIK